MSNIIQAWLGRWALVSSMSIAAAFVVAPAPTMANDAKGDGVFPEWGLFNTYYPQHSESINKFCAPNTGARKPVIFVGDSITMLGDWERLFPGRLIENQGLGSDSTLGVLVRLDCALRGHPDKLFIMIGINDIVGAHMTAKATFLNYRTIIDKASISVGKLYVVSTLFPRSGSREVERLNGMLRKYIGGMRTDKVKFIDANSHLASGKGLNQTFVRDDGIHLNDQGYMIFADILRPYIDN